MTLRNAILTIVVLLVVFLTPVTHAQGTDPDLRILFTGYLLGYYRVPNRQIADFQPDCKQNDDTVKRQPSDALIQRIATAKQNAVLVGAGDNLAVELGSRTWGEDAIDLSPKTRSPESQGWPDEIRPGEIGDNVGCFMSLAGYDAIVPGKNDFYFGPERLRRIAHRLASVPKGFKPTGSNEVFDPVHMLAANLIVKTDYWRKPPEIPGSEKRFRFKLGMPVGVESLTIADNATVLPFLRKIRLRIKPGSPGEQPATLPYLCGEATPGKLDSINPKQCNRLYVSDRKPDQSPSTSTRSSTIFRDYTRALATACVWTTQRSVPRSLIAFASRWRNPSSSPPNATGINLTGAHRMIMTTRMS